MPSIVFTAMIGGIIVQQYQKKRLTAKLLMAQDEAQRMAKVAERERIGRDLHDLLGHTLSLIVLKSELASKLAESDPARAAAEIRDVERISREALSQVRSAVQGYRSGIDQEFAAAQRALAAAGVRVEASVESPELPASQENVLAMALREAVTNVVRHAGATVCRLRVRRVENWCELEVSDDGRGGPLEEGNGLSGMRQRVEALGGILERDGSRGTLLRIRVPV
jgi:two-component system sensor histidine kinase DesK